MMNSLPRFFESIWDFFRYNLPHFLKNLWFFRKELWYFRSWSTTHNLDLLARSLEKTASAIRSEDKLNGYNIKKLQKIERAIELIKGLDNHIEKAEAQLGEIKNLGGFLKSIPDTYEEREHNRKVFELANEIEKAEWDELFDILKGKDIHDYRKLWSSASDKEIWEKHFDGSGLKYWST